MRTVINSIVFGAAAIAILSYVSGDFNWWYDWPSCGRWKYCGEEKAATFLGRAVVIVALILGGIFKPLKLPKLPKFSIKVEEV